MISVFSRRQPRLLLEQPREMLWIVEVVLALAHIHDAHQWVQGLKPAVAVELFDAVEYDDIIFHAAKVGK